MQYFTDTPTYFTYLEKKTVRVDQNFLKGSESKQEGDFKTFGDKPILDILELQIKSRKKDIYR